MSYNGSDNGSTREEEVVEEGEEEDEEEEEVVAEEAEEEEEVVGEGEGRPTTVCKVHKPPGLEGVSRTCVFFMVSML